MNVKNIKPRFQLHTWIACIIQIMVKIKKKKKYVLNIIYKIFILNELKSQTTFIRDY